MEPGETNEEEDLERTGMIVIVVLLSGTFGACFRKEKEEEVIVEKPAEEIRMEIPEREYDLYVAVPIEYMSMRPKIRVLETCSYENLSGNNASGGGGDKGGGG